MNRHHSLRAYERAFETPCSSKGFYHKPISSDILFLKLRKLDKFKVILQFKGFYDIHVRDDRLKPKIGNRLTLNATTLEG